MENDETMFYVTDDCGFLNYIVEKKEDFAQLLEELKKDDFDYYGDDTVDDYIFMEVPVYRPKKK